MTQHPVRLTVFRLAALSLAVLGGLVECAALWRSRLAIQFTAAKRV
jgi:hypothetical protein